MRSYFDPNTGECLYCHASGVCPDCRGDGEILGNDCRACDGLGDCPVCKGDGEREMPEFVELPEYDRHQRRHNHRPGRNRIALEVFNPKIDSYHGHCINAILLCGLPQRHTRQLISQIPTEVSYDQYMAVDGLVYSGQRISVIRDQLTRIFPPWWKRQIMKMFQ